MDSFFLIGARPLVQGSPTMKLHELLDWDGIGHKLKLADIIGQNRRQGSDQHWAPA